MATERRLIDANALKEHLLLCGLQLNASTLGFVNKRIDEQSTVDAVEVVHGRWVDRYGGKYANPLYECSECKKPAPTKCEYDVLGSLEWNYDLTPYCPNCGAKMDGDGNA